MLGMSRRQRTATESMVSPTTAVYVAALKGCAQGVKGWVGSWLWGVVVRGGEEALGKNITVVGVVPSFVSPGHGREVL
jgi:hypothetical protein